MALITSSVMMFSAAGQKVKVTTYARIGRNLARSYRQSCAAAQVACGVPLPITE
jgi:hypothetical protein